MSNFFLNRMEWDTSNFDIAFLSYITHEITFITASGRTDIEGENFKQLRQIATERGFFRLGFIRDFKVELWVKGR